MNDGRTAFDSVHYTDTFAGFPGVIEILFNILLCEIIRLTVWSYVNRSPRQLTIDDGRVTAQNPQQPQRWRRHRRVNNGGLRIGSGEIRIFAHFLFRLLCVYRAASRRGDRQTAFIFWGRVKINRWRRYYSMEPETRKTFRLTIINVHIGT